MFRAMSSSMAMAVAMALLLVVGAAARSDWCELRVARSCRDFQPSSSEDVSRFSWWLSPRCPRNPSVLAATHTDVIRLPDSYLVIADMPGVSSGNLRINASSNRLSFSGLVHDPTPQPPWFAREFYRGALRKLFGREFLLPRHVDSSRVSHSIDNGVLRITLPVDSSQPRSDIQPAAEEGEIGDVLPIRCVCLCGIEEAKWEILPQRLASRWSERPPASCHSNSSFTMHPLTDISEGPGSFELVAEMPGVEPESIRVGVDCSSQEHQKCIVSLSGAVEEGAMELQYSQSLRIERGPSRRVFLGRFAVLPREYSGASVAYRLEDGLLRATVHLPERAET